MECLVLGCTNRPTTAIDLAAGRTTTPAAHRYEAVVCPTHAAVIDRGATWEFREADTAAGWVLLLDEQSTAE